MYQENPLRPETEPRQTPEPDTSAASATGVLDEDDDFNTDDLYLDIGVGD